MVNCQKIGQTQGFAQPYIIKTYFLAVVTLNSHWHNKTMETVTVNLILQIFVIPLNFEVYFRTQSPVIRVRMIYDSQRGETELHID